MSDGAGSRRQWPRVRGDLQLSLSSNEKADTTPMGSNRKNHKSAAAKQLASRPQKTNPERNAKRVNVHGDGKPNHNRNR